MEAPGRLVVVDATNFLFRSFHAIRDLRTRDGQPTNAIYGLTTTLLKIRDDYANAALACVMDAPGKTFRHEMYPEYKATRKPTDPELIAQIEPAKELIRALGIELYCVPNVEADDVVATLAKQGLAAGREVMIASSDKDLMYLTGAGCAIIDPVKKIIMDAAAVTKHYGVPPERMLDYLVLIGDTVDNVPGVPGVGAKTAAKWLAEYGSLANIITHQDEIKGKVGEKFRAAVPLLGRSTDLIRLKEDVPVTPLAKQLELPQPDGVKVSELCQKFRFNPDLQERMVRGTSVKPAVLQVLVETLRTAAEFDAAANFLAGVNRMGLHIEISGSSAPAFKMVSCALYGGERGFYIPLGHASDLADINADYDLGHAFLGRLLANEKLQLCIFDAKPFLHILQNAGINYCADIKDVGLQAYCQDSSASGNLETTSRRYLNYSIPLRADIVGGRNKPAQFADLEVAIAAGPAAAWAQATFDLRRTVGRALDAAAMQLYNEIEQPVIEVLVAMERAGIMIDVEELRILNKQLRKRMVGLEDKIAASAGERVNLNSPSQLGALLYDHLGLDAGHKTRKGARSTNETELERLAQGDSPIPKLVLEYRHLAKLVGTYTEVLPKMVNPQTGRLHTRFIQAGAVTGRLASVDPNLQNIPVRTVDGQRIRKCFVAPSGTVLLSADYSQIELRILAHFSQDATLLEAFAQGQDVHQRTASELFNINADKVSPEQRRFAKTINFGLIYGMGAFGLAQRMNIPQKEAKVLIHNYFARLPGVQEYLEQIKEQASEHKEVITLCGRRIGIAPRSAQHAGGAMRAAINAPMQGTAADIMKLAMSAVYKCCSELGLHSQMLLQVHDELVLETPSAEIDQTQTMLKEVMGGVVKLSVPLEVDIVSGSNWDEAH